MSGRTHFVHRGFWLAVLLEVGIGIHLRADEAFKDHSFFKRMAGEWTCDGELKDGEGKSVKIHEDWKGEFLGDTTFSVSGKRKIGERTEDFTWTFIRNPASGLIEATHLASAGTDDPMRFEVSVLDDGLKIEMIALLKGTAKLTVVESFARDDENTIRDKIDLIDESGAAALSGELLNKRVKPNMP